MKFNEELRYAREQKGMTQQQVADKLGIDKSTYCGYETGKRKPDVKRIKELALLLEVSTDKLIGTGAVATQPEHMHVSAASDDDIKFALFGGGGDITDEMYAEVKNFAEYVKKREEDKRRG